MTLSHDNLVTLATHATLSPSIDESGSDYLAIADYYDSYPVTTLEELTSILTPLDKHKYFKLERFGDWYSGFNLKLHQGTAKIVVRDNINAILSDSDLVLRGILSLGLTSHTMQDLIMNLCQRKLYDTLFSFFVCLASDDVFEESTIWLLGIELSPYKRWQSLDFPSAPTVAEIEFALTL